MDGRLDPLFIGAAIGVALLWALRMSARLRALEKRMDQRALDFEPTKPPTALGAETMNVARMQGKVAAIKFYRDQTRAGLKDAKDEVERLMRSEGLG